MTAAVSRDCDMLATQHPDLPLYRYVTDLDSYGCDSPANAESLHSEPPPSGRRPRRPKLVPDLARAATAIDLLAPWACDVTLWRLSLTAPDGTTIAAVRAVLAAVSVLLGRLGPGRGGVGWVDVRADGAGPHLYVVASAARPEIVAAMKHAVALVGGDPKCQRLDPVTAWDAHAAGCDAAGRLPTELGRAFAYGAKPWAVGVRDPILDVTASGVFAPLGLSHSSHSAASTVTAAKVCAARCGKPLDGRNDRRKTCGDSCRKALSRLEARRRRDRDRRAAVVCDRCFDDHETRDHERSTAEGATPAAPALDRACSALGRVAGAAPPPVKSTDDNFDPASRGPAGLSDEHRPAGLRLVRPTTTRYRKDHEP